MPKRDIASCSSGQVLLRPQSSEPICAKTVLIECVSAFDRSVAPKRSPLSLWIACPYSVNVPVSTKRLVGVNLPLASAAAAVMTLNVEPGG